jgi:hypothetical protein
VAVVDRRAGSTSIGRIFLCNHAFYVVELFDCTRIYRRCQGSDGGRHDGD